MRSASNDAHNDMNDTKGVRIGYSRGELHLSIGTRAFLIIAQKNPIKVLNYILGIAGVHTSL